MNRNLTRTALLTPLVVGALCLSGCGGSSSKSSPAGTTIPTAASSATTPAPAATTAASSAAASSTTPPSSQAALPTSAAAARGGASAGNTDSCTNATVAVNKATNAIPQSSQVGDIELKHGCSTVAITTYLTAGDKAGTAAALVICTASATPAYANGVGAVSVYAVDGSTVIASGTKGSACKGA